MFFYFITRALSVSSLIGTTVSVGVIHNGCTSRCTQTIGHIIRDSSGDTYITQNLNQLRVIVNHEAMDMLIKNDFRVDKVQGR